MLKAALYCRLSDAGPDSGAAPKSESIHNQKSLLLRYAVAHDFEVEQIYADDNYSGTDLTRPAFRQMIRDAEARRFDVILVKNQSRFTRDLGESELYLHRKFPEWGIRLIAVMDGVDTDAEGGLKKQQLNGLVNGQYRQTGNTAAYPPADPARGLPAIHILPETKRHNRRPPGSMAGAGPCSLLPLPGVL